MDVEKKVCTSCGKELARGDFGYYCDNPKCELYDVGIYLFENEV